MDNAIKSSLTFLWEDNVNVQEYRRQQTDNQEHTTGSMTGEGIYYDDGQYRQGAEAVKTDSEANVIHAAFDDVENASMTEGLIGGFIEAMVTGMAGQTIVPVTDRKVNDVAVIMSTVRQELSDLRRQQVDEVIAGVGNAHLQTVDATYASVAEATRILADMAADKSTPDMSKMSINPNVMWQQFVQSMASGIKNVVKFCKRLPGFTEIDMEDQVILVKQGAFEILLVRMCMLVDHEKEEMLDPKMTMKCPRAIVKTMPMGYFLDQFFSIAEQFNPLALTDEERGMFSAILMFCPERNGLQNKVIIEKLQTLCNQSMYSMMKRHHADYDSKFRHLQGLVPVFQDINQKHTAMMDVMKQHSDIIRQLPDLQKEIWDVSEQ